MKITTLVAAISAGFSYAVVAQTERDLESHEHGLALLNIAIDSELLFIELDTPWNNLVGFEHKPGNSEQQSLVDDALALLNEPQELFDFEGANCTVIDTLVENSASDDEEHDDGHDEEHKDGHDEKHDDGHDEEHKDGHDEEHDDGHDEEHKDGHGEEHEEEHKDKDGHDEGHGDSEHHEDEHSESEHDDHGDEGDTHSAVRVSYSFECDNINKLEAIDVKIFKLWSGFEELDAQLIGPTGQAAAELTPNAVRLDVTQIQ